MNRYASPKPLLQLDEHVDDLRLDRHVERRHRLVADQQRRLERERARDADALALAAGELVRIALGHVGQQAHACASSSATRSSYSARERRPCARPAARRRCRATVMRGFSEP